MMDINQITEIIIGAAYRVHNNLGAGFLEKVYENAIYLELVKAGLTVRQQQPIKVFYMDHSVGEYFADLWVEECVIVELKAVNILTSEHELQLVNYLNATGVDIGLLINFGKSVQVKRKFRLFNTRKNPVQS